MSASLETRAPFLDPRTVEFAWRLPPSAKIDRGTGKRILRDILCRHVPRELVERPKQGFAVPLDAWLRGSLREWASELVSKCSTEKTGVLRSNAVARVWTDHIPAAITRARGYGPC
jgi:asparagine synthase (glutamine-hydrolysing)